MGGRCPRILQHDLRHSGLAPWGYAIEFAVLPDLDLLRLATDGTTTQMD
jgi:hypothetical protein